MTKYDLVLADFAWPGYSPFGTAKLPYGGPSYEQTRDFPWNDLLAKRAVVFLWTTGPFLLTEQTDIIRSWGDRHGLVYRGVAFVWVKTKQTGEPIGASGPRPSIVKPLCEFVVSLSTVRKGRPFPLLSESVRQVVMAPKPRVGEHSRKPVEVHHRIFELYGDRPRIELFARTRPPAGWDAMGDELPDSDVQWDLEINKIVP